MRLLLGDCVERMGEIESGSVDAIITDPPYPEIDRPYGRMTEAEWDSMMRRLIPECRRALKPTGSAVFILQPNSEKVGRMRPWLWEFMAWTTREWNMVQDAWWWNTSTLPLTKNDPNKLRGGLKPCVWLGSPECYRDASSVLWRESDRNAAERLAGRCTEELEDRPSRTNMRAARAYGKAAIRGGVQPHNVIPIGGGGNLGSGGHDHGGRTPLSLADWWTRYISPPDGVVCDPFLGSGTMGLAALARGRDFIGIERDPNYFAIATARIDAALASTPLLTGAAP